MKEYVKTDKFGCECDYLTEGKVYKVFAILSNSEVRIRDDDSDLLFIHKDYSAHTESKWYFCDANGDKSEV